ncbi:MAG TPA: DUF6165 family protein, partial [Gemmataceae bacterium]|nr:DUF6165 family protein [Gemmataceae bacterium]
GEARNNLGVALTDKGLPAEAAAVYRQVLHERPLAAEAHNNLGVLLEQQGKLTEATPCYEASLRIKPQSPDTHKNLALSWLMHGDYGRGWAEYEWRWRCSPVRTFVQPRWEGRPLRGEEVLIYAEQGLGDTIQFVRYARLVQERGARVLVECPPPLERLLSRCPGIDRLIPQGTSLPDFAYQAPFLSLPGIFHTTLETVPAAVPYLSAEPALLDTWGAELADVAGFRIGIAWQGSKKYAGDAHRSIPLSMLEPLARLPGVRLISLQKGLGSEQLRDLGERWPVLDLGDRLDAAGAFVDTAAIMTHLDLVVTSDTAVAHLAGALGVPVWIALSVASDWRWLRDREDSPWYPTVRLFRQQRWGDWPDVFERMAGELQRTSPGRCAPVVVEVSPGELVDKITILEIKRERVRDEKKLHNIRIELGGLLAARARTLRGSHELTRLTSQLKAVNVQLWQIEDDIRQQETRQDFGDRFIALARSVYQKNDERAALKRHINELLGARLVEEKAYAYPAVANDARQD